ncbi:hypothetical protein N9E04_00195 [bacterium]|nr:hypothetical protein [bacterium]
MSLTFTTEQATPEIDSGRRRPVSPLGISAMGLVLAGAVASVLAVFGVSWASALVVGLIVVIQAVFGGVVTTLIAQRPATVLEFLGAGLAVGSALAVVLGILMTPLGVGARAWGWLVVAGATIVGALIVGRRRTSRLWGGLVWDRPSALVAALGGGAVGLAAVAANLARYPLSGPWERFHPDIPFFEALGTSAVKFGPGVSAFMSGDEIRYHWFSYAWPGQLTVAMDLDPFVALTRVVPVVVVLGLAALTAGVAGRIGRSWWGPALAVALVISGGFAGAAYGVISNVDSPSTAMTTLWLLGFVVLAFGSRLDPRAGFAIALTTGFLLSGAKVSAIATVVVAWIVLVILGVAWRTAWARTALVQFGGLLLGAVLSFFLFVFGSASSGDLRILSWEYRASTVQGLDISSSWWGVAIGTLLLSIAILPRAAGIVGLQGRSAEAALGVGLVTSSIVPIWVLSQGVNELWFAVASAAPLAVLSVLGLERLWERAAAHRAMAGWGLTSVLAGLISAGAVAVLWPLGASDVVTVRSIGSLVPWLIGACVASVAVMRSGRAMGIAVLATSLVVTASVGRGITAFGDVGLESSTGRNAPTATEFVATTPPPGLDSNSETLPASSDGAPPMPARVGSVQWSPSRNEAALWLRNAAASEDVLAVNQPESAMIPAVSATRTYLSAAPYQEMYGSRGQAPLVGERQAYSLDLANGLTPELAAVFCSAGVDWLWIDNSGSDVDLPVAFANDEVTIYALTSASCTT